ncbi:MAG: primosomal protein N', partial [Thermoleophilia bacterium]|nr:primosomal protein N' [Thermoleophilia bacterium]
VDSRLFEVAPPQASLASIEAAAASAAAEAHNATLRAVSAWPLVPSRSFDEPLTWLLPAELDQSVVIGSALEVPVGNARRVAIVAALDVPRPEGVKLRPAFRVIDIAPVPESLISLAVWLADQFGCARTRALSLVVSPKIAAHARAADVPTRTRVLAVRRTNVAVPEEGLTKRLRTVVDALATEWTAVARVAEALNTTRASLNKLLELKLVEIENQHVDELAEVEVPQTDVDREGDEAALVAALAEAAAVNAGLVAAGAGTVELTDEQVAAVAACEASDCATLVMGVTGSGKTEVYLELIARTLPAGRGAIVLVPEIALTPQTAGRFVTRFPGTVQVLHSGMTRHQRAVAWDRVVAGDARVVVGPRSAVFAPVSGLGVIVIDEEHDGSYKQDSEPRYDARRVAWRRALLDDAKVVFGTATPRPESWHGVANRARLHRRAAGGELAPVQLVDLREAGDSFPITDQLGAAIDATLRRGRKVIVLHNRRGYANALNCRSCGYCFRCKLCDVSLIVHGQQASNQTLACHHCGFREPVPRSCPSCHAVDVARVGAGTEKLELELAERFGVEVVRLDADAARVGGGVAPILERFANAGPAILTGTQMVAKGHDFPDVELAAVIDADTALAIPDFRAEERAFSLVAQLAGRAGRSAATAEHAKVIVQTWDTEQRFIEYAKTHDVEGFLTSELDRRLTHGYPPFTRIVRVLISARLLPDAEGWAFAVAEGMQKLEAGPVLGPAPLLRLSGRERAQVIVKTTHAVAVAAALRAFIGSTQQRRQRADVRMLLDVDPQSLV